MRILALALVLSPLALPAVAQQTAQQATAFETVSSETFSRKPVKPLLIDVREPGEWADTGMPAESRGVSISRADFVAAVLAEVGGDMTRPVAVICKSGSRSVRAADQLAKAGFTSVTNVGDGMMGREGVGKGWLAAGLSTKRPQ